MFIFFPSHISFAQRHAIKRFNVCNVLLGCVGIFLWFALLTFENLIVFMGA